MFSEHLFSRTPLNGCFWLIFLLIFSVHRKRFSAWLSQMPLIKGKFCLLFHSILEKLWEMTRNLLILDGYCTHNFKNLSSFLHGYHLPYNLKILLSQPRLSHSTISKFCQPSTWNFFGFVISLNFFFISFYLFIYFLEKSKNDVLIAKLQLLLLLTLLC